MIQTATLKKIDELKIGSNGRDWYRRLHFWIDNVGYAMTDVVVGFINEKNWLPIIQAGPGTVIENFKMLGRSKIDADSVPRIVAKQLFSKQLSLSV